MATTSPSRRHLNERPSAVTRQHGVSRERIIVGLSAFVAVAALSVASIGLFWHGPSGARTFTTIHGEPLKLFGHGLYRFDSLFAGAGYRGTDAVTISLGVPLLLAGVVWFGRGSLRGALLLCGTLSYMLYVYASMAFGAAFNGLFLAYVAIFSASLFAMALTIGSIDVARLDARLRPGVPRRGTAVFLLVSGVVTAVVWLQPLLGDMLRGSQPKLLDGYTTMVTDVLDLGIITPLLFLSGVLLLRRVTFGYLIAFPLIGIIVVLAPAIVASTISQWNAGVDFTPGEMIGPIAGFTLIGAFAIGFLVVLLRHVRDSAGV